MTIPHTRCRCHAITGRQHDATNEMYDTHQPGLKPKLAAHRVNVVLSHTVNELVTRVLHLVKYLKKLGCLPFISRRIRVTGEDLTVFSMILDFVQYKVFNKGTLVL